MSFHLSEEVFVRYAMNAYQNPACYDVKEFEEDLKRFQYLRKLFLKYKKFGDLKERLILNHIIVLYNIFGYKASNMLYMKLEGYHQYLKPFTDYLNYTPKFIEYNDKQINSEAICSDLLIENMLQNI